MKIKSKALARNKILRKLVSSIWGARPHVLQSSALGLCYPAAECASPVDCFFAQKTGRCGVKLHNMNYNGIFVPQSANAT